MSLREKVAQLLHPFVRPQQSEAEIRTLLGDLEPGGVFIMAGTGQEIRRTAELLQRPASVPIVISSDMECGPGRMIKDGTGFPTLLSLAATGRADLARAMGRASAREGREVGFHWNFAPVVDINLSAHNPIANVRSLGDRAETILELGWEFIAGMQENGLAGCAKHFPGDGVDSRDQHVCTSVNPLGREAWWNSFGRLYRQLIDNGLMSIMIGHISLPAFDPGSGPAMADAPPATLSSKITTDLLRGELGFQGLIISDASVMGGVTSWGPREEIIPAMVAAGCDQILFCDFLGDFEILLRAVEDGRLPLARVDDAVARVLEFKERLGLFDRQFGDPLPPAEREANGRAAREQAEGALTLVTDRFGAVPLALAPEAKVLNYHIRGDVAFNVDAIDGLLTQCGFDVTRRTEQDLFSSSKELDGFDAVLVHVVYVPGWSSNRIRLSGNFLRNLIPSVPLHDRRVVFISYGTPYLLHDLPRIPALINAYSPDPLTQRAVADLLLGRIAPRGISPVNLELDHSWFAYRQPG